MSIGNRFRTSRNVNQLISDVRNCRTDGEMASLINYECARIRESLSKSKKSKTDSIKNIGKVIYLNMLGYSTHFAQLECLNLMISDKFSQKRLGYLAATVLFDSNSETHLLLTNVLKKDLFVHSRQEVINLALNCLANIKSELLLREFVDEVSILAQNGSRQIRKKALFVAESIVRCVPNAAEAFFTPVFRIVSSDGREVHGLVYSAVTLLTAICEVGNEYREYCGDNILDKVVSLIEHQIRSQNRSSVCFIDAFSLISLIRLIKAIGRTSKEITSLFCQAFFVGQNSNRFSVIWEIMFCFKQCNDDEGIRQSMDFISNFLTYKYVHFRFTALSIMKKFVHSHKRLVSEHLTEISACLLENVPTLSNLALYILKNIVSEDNVDFMIESLLSYLENRCPANIKSECCRAVMLNARKYCISINWYVDVVLKTVHFAGKFVENDFVFSLIQTILCMESAERLPIILKIINNMTPACPQMTQVAVWCVGEYCDLLISGGFWNGAEELVDMVVSMALRKIDVVLIQYGLVSLTKLGNKVGTVKERVRGIIEPYSHSNDPDVQQRAYECLHVLDRGGFFSDKINEEMEFTNGFGGGDTQYAEKNEKSELSDMFGFNELSDHVAEFDGKTEKMEESCLTVYDGDKISVRLLFPSCPGPRWGIDVVVDNRTLSVICNLHVKVAVLKNMKVEMCPPSTTVVKGFGSFIQNIFVTTENVEGIKMKLRVAYNVDGDTRCEDITVDEIPPYMWK